MNYMELSRAILLKHLYDMLSDEEKKVLILTHLKKSSNEEILRTLHVQGEQLTDIQKRVDQHTWISDFGANVAGNAAYGVAIWLFERMLKKIV